MTDLSPHLFGLDPLPNVHPLPEGTQAIKAGTDWRAQLKASPDWQPQLVSHPSNPSRLAQQQMLLHLAPALRAMFVQTLRRTVLGEQAPRLYLEPAPSVIQPTTEDVHEYSPQTKTTALLIPQPEEVNVYGLEALHANYAREHAAVHEDLERLGEKLGRLHDEVRAYTEALANDPQHAAERFDAILNLSGEAAYLVANQVEGSSMRDAIDSVAARVEIMLEKEMIRAMRDLQTPEQIREYATAARAMIREKLEPKPETAEIVSLDDARRR